VAVQTSATDTLLVIRDAVQLRTLSTTRALLSPRALVLELPGLSPQEAHAASERIVSYSHECGCSFGAKCMAAGFGFAVVWLALGLGVWTWQFLWRLPWALLCAFTAAGLGKWVAIARARTRLSQEIENLIASHATFPAPEV